MCEEQLEIEHFLQEMQELKNTDITKFTSTLVYNKLLLILINSVIIIIINVRQINSL